MTLVRCPSLSEALHGCWGIMTEGFTGEKIDGMRPRDAGVGDADWRWDHDDDIMRI